MADSGAKVSAALPAEVQPILSRLAQLAEGQGWACYLVGGFVRDALLEREQHDIDISVVGDGMQLAEMIAAEIGTAVETTGRFGTATVTLPGAHKDLDFVTARSETYPTPGSLPIVQPGSIQDDLARRDFTVNALAVPIRSDGLGAYIDPHDGLADLEAKLIRVLHAGSFKDDPTRIFRAVKLEARLGFRIEPGTLELILQAVRDGALATVSTERSVHELLLILAEPEADTVLAHLQELGVPASVHPGLAWLYKPGKMRPTQHAGTTQEQTRNAYLAVFAAEYASDPPEAEALARWLHLPAPAIVLVRDAARLAQLWPRLSNDDLSPSQVYRLLNDLDPSAPQAYSLLEPLASDTVAWGRLQHYLSRTRHVRPAIKGSYLQSLGIPPGPIYSEALAALHEAVLDEKVVGREEEERFLREWLRERGLPAGS